MNTRMALFVALTVLVSCAARPRPDSGEFFDERSGNTLSVVAKPLVFARERSDVAAHARDYATLVAIELDRSGEFSQYLLLYRWSTVDPRMSPPPAPEAGALRLLADGRPIDLAPLERLPIGLEQRRNLHVPNQGYVVSRAYRVDSALLQFLAACHTITLRMPQESLDTPFTIWRDGRAALGRFLRRTVGP